MFIQLLFENPEFYFTWVILVAFSICVHEYFHAWMAMKQGDTTAADAGYLTLNPLILMGPTSFIMLAVIGIAWGAVPVNPQRLRSPLRQTLVSVAGPAANLMLFVGFAILANTIGGRAASLELMGNVGMMANAFLLLFNLLPIPGLDGWQVVELLVPSVRRIPREKKTGAGWFLLLLILLTGAFEHIWRAAAWLSDLVV